MTDVLEFRKYLPPQLGMKVEKLAICYPWGSPFIWTKHHQNALNMERPKGIESRWFQGQGWCPARRHIHFCEQAVDWGASHILILGADQTFPEDLIPRLVKRVEVDGCEVITALVPTRGLVHYLPMRPFQPVAFRFKDGTQASRWRTWEQDKDMLELIEPGDNELELIDFIGSGCIMFPVDDLLKMPTPWFYEVYQKQDLCRQASMDTRFIFEMKKFTGAQIWLDTTIKIGHLNDMIVDDTYQYKFTREDWKEEGYGSAPANVK